MVRNGNEKKAQRIKRCNWFQVKNTHAAHNVIQKPFHHQQLSECFLLSQTAIIKCLLNVFTVKRCDRGVWVTQKITQASWIPPYIEVCWFSFIVLFSGPYNQNQCFYRPRLPLTAIVGWWPTKNDKNAWSFRLMDKHIICNTHTHAHHFV